MQKISHLLLHTMKKKSKLKMVKGLAKVPESFNNSHMICILVRLEH